MNSRQLRRMRGMGVTPSGGDWLEAGAGWETTPGMAQWVRMKMIISNNANNVHDNAIFR